MMRSKRFDYDIMTSLSLSGLRPSSGSGPAMVQAGQRATERNQRLAK